MRYVNCPLWFEEENKAEIVGPKLNSLIELSLNTVLSGDVIKLKTEEHYAVDNEVFSAVSQSSMFWLCSVHYHKLHKYTTSNW